MNTKPSESQVIYSFIDAIISRALTVDQKVGADLLRIILAEYRVELDNKRVAGDVACRLITLGVSFELCFVGDKIIIVGNDD